jgi:hypothetical protein
MYPEATSMANLTDSGSASMVVVVAPMLVVVALVVVVVLAVVVIVTAVVVVETGTVVEVEVVEVGSDVVTEPPRSMSTVAPAMVPSAPITCTAIVAAVRAPS